MARTDKGKRRARDEEESENEASDAGEVTDYDEEETSKARKNKKSAKGKGKGKGKGKKAAAGTDNEDTDAGSDDEGGKKKGKTAPLTDDDKKRLAFEMARHALVCELNKKPIRREDVSKTFMAGRIRHFDAIVGFASQHLSRSFGLEIVLMRPKESTANKNPPKTYFVRSKLPAHILRNASLKQFDELRTESDDSDVPKTDLYGQVTHYRADGETPGLLRDWRFEEGSSYAILGVILAIILVNGKALPDDQLVSHMKKLHIFPESRINSSIATFAPQPPNFRQFLATLIRQNYLERNVISNSGTGVQTQAGGGGATQGTQKGRGRPSMNTSNKNAADDMGDPTVEWKWGARAEAEIGEHGIAKFIEAVYAGTASPAQAQANAADVDAEDENASGAGAGDEDEEMLDGENAGAGKQNKKKDGQPSTKELRVAITKSAGSKELRKATAIKSVG